MKVLYFSFTWMTEFQCISKFNSIFRRQNKSNEIILELFSKVQRDFLAEIMNSVTRMRPLSLLLKEYEKTEVYQLNNFGSISFEFYTKETAEYVIIFIICSAIKP